MARCVEFYQKWANDPNWCEKCNESVRLINNYIDLTAAFEEQGILKKTTMVGFSERAARPLFEKRNATIKEQAITQIAELLRGGNRCAAGNRLRKLLGPKLGPEKPLNYSGDG